MFERGNFVNRIRDWWGYPRRSEKGRLRHESDTAGAILRR
jgi:hypothetical protein